MKRRSGKLFGNLLTTDAMSDELSFLYNFPPNKELDSAHRPEEMRGTSSTHHGFAMAVINFLNETSHQLLNVHLLK